jgi:hypothetical protein
MWVGPWAASQRSDCRPEILEKGLDFHRHGPDGDAAYDLLSTWLVRIVRGSGQYIHISANRYANGRYAAAKQRALDAHVGENGGEHAHQLVEQLPSVSAAALGEDRGDAGVIE